MHLCHAHFAREHGSEGSYEPIMDALNKINVGTVSLEYATPVSFGVGSLARFGDKARLYALHQHASASLTSHVAAVAGGGCCAGGLAASTTRTTTSSRPPRSSRGSRRPWST